ncbi:hypothetical protein APHAL10511_004603 [Amanita phalloides]|nr:hypothetical protein APHAL10511_004603 [Amanita phalloides]
MIPGRRRMLCNERFLRWTHFSDAHPRWIKNSCARTSNRGHQRDCRLANFTAADSSRWEKLTARCPSRGWLVTQPFIAPALYKKNISHWQHDNQR